MANVFKINSRYKVKKFSDNYGTLKQLPNVNKATENHLQTQYNNIQQTLSINNQQFDNRNLAEKLLGINSDTKQHAGILQGTLDIITRPLDAIKASVFDLQHGKGGQDILSDLIQGITEGKGKNLSGTQILGLENAHLDTFTKFIVNTSVDIGLDPLTYIPGGVIFKGLKKIGTEVNKLPIISPLLQHAKTTDFGVAVKNLYNVTKNTLGKNFQWMYGTSKKGKELFSKLEADGITTTHELFNVVDNLLKGREKIGQELFDYTTKGLLPADKVFKSIYKDTREAKEFLDNSIQKLGIENPETTFKRWVKENYNGNVIEGKKNLVKLITNPNNKYYVQEWENYTKSGNYLNPDGTYKDIEQATQSFWLKITNDWKELTPEEVQMRFSSSIYDDYILANPPKKTLNTALKALNNGQIVLPTNDPIAIKTFLKQLSKITGLEDPLLDASYIKYVKKDKNGNLIREVDNELVAQRELELNKAKNDLENYKGTSQSQKYRLKNKVKDLEQNLESIKIGTLGVTYKDISNEVYSTYFNIEKFKDYGKKSAQQLQTILDRMRNSKDINIKKEYEKLVTGNEIHTVLALLKESEGQGVKITIKSKWNPTNDIFLNNSKQVISKPNTYTRLSTNKTGDQIKNLISEEINLGIKHYLKDELSQNISSTGVLGLVIKDFSQLKGLSDEEVIEITNKLTKEVMDLDVKFPSYQLTPYKGYGSEQYVSSLTYLNSSIYQMISRFKLDPSKLQQSNILRNCTNPELAKFLRLIKIQQGSNLNAFLDLNKETNYLGVNPAKLLNSEWLLNANEINKTVGFKLISTDPLNSMAETLKIWPKSIRFASIIKGAIKTQDIRVLTSAEKLNYELKRIVPQGKQLIKGTELIKRFEAIKDLIPSNELEEFEKNINKFSKEDNLFISIGLEDQLANMTKAPSDILGVADYMNKFISVWKKVLLITPGYHARNMFSNFSQIMSSGISYSKILPHINQAYTDIVKVNKINNKILTQLGETKELLQTEEQFHNFIDTFLPKNEALLYKEYTQLARKGVTAQAKVNSDFWEITNKIGKTTMKNNKFAKGWDTVFNSNMKLAYMTDDGMRLALYRFSLQEPKYALKNGLVGATNEELAESFVRFTFFDYNAMTNFEKNTLRKIFPFYTWSRKNFEYQLRLLINRPERFNRLNKIFNDWNEAQGYDTSEEPDWVKNNMWLPIVHGENVTFLKVGMPIQDIGSIFNGNGEILSRLNPFYKLITESITGKNSFTNENTDLLHSFQGMFWQPLQKLLVQPFDIPLGALPLGNGKTLGEVFGHPNNYSQKTSMWYNMNISSLHQSYLFQEIQKLHQFEQLLQKQGVMIQSQKDLLKLLKNNKFPTIPKLQKFKQYKLTSKNFKR